MPDSETLLIRGNLVAEDPKSDANNGGHGLTRTLTENIFNKSFGDWEGASSKFGVFGWAPRKVIGAGIKNIQVGVKSARPYMAYAVGDFLQLFIDNRTKIYESRIGDLQVRLQVSLDFPPNGHVDKFINPNEYVKFMAMYRESLSQSMSFTIYQLLKVMFCASAFEMCLPSEKFTKFLLANLSGAKAGLPQQKNTHPVLGVLHDHSDTVKALVDELRMKITNCFVFDVGDFLIRAGTESENGIFNPYNVGQDNEKEPRKNGSKLMKVLADSGALRSTTLFSDDSGSHHQPIQRHSREESLKAFSIALSSILSDIELGDPKSRGWQGNRGNIYKEEVWTNNSGNEPQDRIYPENKGTVIMDKKFLNRPMLQVKSSKDNLVLIMSQEDYTDFTQGDYEGYFGSQSMAVLNFKNSVMSKVSEVIPVPGMVGGHAIIMDKRMFAIIPHLEHTGTDTLNQRLATVDTIHRGFIFGMFDQFVGARIQMVSYTARPIDSESVFFEYREKKSEA